MNPERRFKTIFETMDSVVKTASFAECCRKVFIHVSTWIAEKDLMKHYQQRKNFTITWQ